MEKEENTVYIGYGIGDYYAAVKEEVKERIPLSYLCDRKWDGVKGTRHDGIGVIERSRLAELPNKKAVIFSQDQIVKDSIAADLEKLGVPYIFADELLKKRRLNGKTIKQEGRDGLWEDAFGNQIYFEETLPDTVFVDVKGKGSIARFGKNFLANHFELYLGNDAVCEIGDNTRIVETKIYAAYAKVKIGDYCLFSSDTVIRTHDAHYIFDRNTHERINKPTDVVLGDQVWVCAGATLLAGAEIGTGSVVGAHAVTSSRFHDHVILAGNPARVIREEICWCKDDSSYTNYDTLEECTNRETFEYL